MADDILQGLIAGRNAFAQRQGQQFDWMQYQNQLKQQEEARKFQQQQWDYEQGAPGRARAQFDYENNARLNQEANAPVDAGWLAQTFGLDNLPILGQVIKPNMTRGQVWGAVTQPINQTRNIPVPERQVPNFMASMPGNQPQEQFNPFTVNNMAYNPNQGQQSNLYAQPQSQQPKMFTVPATTRQETQQVPWIQGQQFVTPLSNQIDKRVETAQNNELKLANTEYAKALARVGSPAFATYEFGVQQNMLADVDKWSQKSGRGAWSSSPIGGGQLPGGRQVIYSAPGPKGNPYLAEKLAADLQAAIDNDSPYLVSIIAPMLQQEQAKLGGGQPPPQAPQAPQMPPPQYANGGVSVPPGGTAPYNPMGGGGMQFSIPKSGKAARAGITGGLKDTRTQQEIDWAAGAPARYAKQEADKAAAIALAAKNRAEDKKVKEGSPLARNISQETYTRLKKLGFADNVPSAHAVKVLGAMERHGDIGYDKESKTWGSMSDETEMTWRGRKVTKVHNVKWHVDDTNRQYANKPAPTGGKGGGYSTADTAVSQGYLKRMATKYKGKSAEWIAENIVWKQHKHDWDADVVETTLKQYGAK